MPSAAHGHPSSFQGHSSALSLQDDVEKRLQAYVAKDLIRIKQFFIDFDKLRKGTVGEAGVSYGYIYLLVPNLLGHSWHPPKRRRYQRPDHQIPRAQWRWSD